MYVDLIDNNYDSQIFNLTSDDLGPLSQPVDQIKEYLSLIASFVLVFGA